MAVEGVLLDIDGTLVLSNDAHAQSWVEAFAAHGYDIDYAQVRPLMGMGGDKVIPQLVSELNDEEGVGQQIAEHRKEIVINKYGPQISAANGARQMVEKLKQEGLHLIVATSASQKELDLMLKVADIEDLVKEFTSSDDAENSKPAPDIVAAALTKANL
ncbi:MAG TPA: HAD family hydrolase, partial [Trichocoleus sp.]